MTKSTVYFTKDITASGLQKIYEALNCKLRGNVAVKISTGEPGGHNFLNPKLIQPLVNYINGTIVECCTAYRGKRFNVNEHYKAIKDHGFADIAPCDILDEFGEIKIAVNGGKHLKGYNIVGEKIQKYNSMLVLSHFKGHQMAGMGGALKNMSIGLASKNGKAWIHSWGNTCEPNKLWDFVANQNAFLESMAEACKGVVDYLKPQNIVYINVANNLSVDCDCNSNPAKPQMADIGIFASLDPVALDQACYDAVINCADTGKHALIERMTSKNAIHIVEEAERLGLGNRKYNLVVID